MAVLAQTDVSPRKWGMGSLRLGLAKGLARITVRYEGAKSRAVGEFPVRQEDKMRRHAIGAVALAVFAVPVLGGTSTLAVQPSAGIYNTLQYVVSATPSRGAIDAFS